LNKDIANGGKGRLFIQLGNMARFVAPMELKYRINYMLTTIVTIVIGWSCKLEIHK
jgi:hypothetical protein